MSVTFPNVPNAPGVPQVARAFVPNPTSVAVTFGGALLSSLFGLISSQSQWGILDSSGSFVLQADSILEFEHHPKWDILDFPVQGTGNNPTSFASYNKVKLPFDCRVRMSKGSTLTERQQFLKALGAAADSIALYTILTPEASYQNADILNYDIVRSSQGDRADGAFFLTEVDVYFRQIVSVQAQYSTTELQNAANPSAQPQAQMGVVQPLNGNGALLNKANSATYSDAFGAF
jgi:hypothetical protein